MRTHGMRHSLEYISWYTMRQRCLNPNYDGYPYYGGRGVTISSDWNDFSIFYRDMGPRPSASYTLDRIDHDGSYCKANCRWATKTQQANNRRDNRLITINGTTKTLAQWCRELNLNYARVYARLTTLKWSAERAMELEDK